MELDGEFLEVDTTGPIGFVIAVYYNSTIHWS